MLYFKPPGAREQTLHQDQQHITIDSLLGVWIALDRSDSAVSHMIVVPRSRQLGLLPAKQADTFVPFTPAQAVGPEAADEEAWYRYDAWRCVVLSRQAHPQLLSKQHPKALASFFYLPLYRTTREQV